MIGKTAVVLGGSIAGLCAAGAAAPYFDEVIVLERDLLPPGAEHRRGVPQSKHPHFLLNSGRRAMNAIFPGFEKELIAAGGHLLMPSQDAAYCENDGWAPRSKSTMTMFYGSRVLIERVLRNMVREHGNVSMRENVVVTGLVGKAGGTAGGRVTGVEFRNEEGDLEQLTADLVVDALGRGSAVGDWLSAAGWPTTPENTLDAKVVYSSRWYKLPDERPSTWWWKHMAVTPTQDTGSHPPEHEYLSNIFPIEDDKVIINMGSWGLDMPRKAADFEAAADAIRPPLFGQATRMCTPISEVFVTRSTGNKWRRFDQLPEPPYGLVSIGDSICAFNPFYAQGMSSAALGAHLLQERLAASRGLDKSFFREFLKQQKALLDVPWMLAMARDQAYDFAVGTEVVPPWRRKLTARMSWPVFNAIIAAAREDSYVEETFAAVFNLEKSMKEMASDPRFVYRVIRSKLRTMAGLSASPGGYDYQQEPPALRDRQPASGVAHGV